MLCAVCALPAVSAHAQAIDTVLLAEQSFTELPFVYSTYASLLDREGRAFLYTAGAEYGLHIYDISNLAAPAEVLVLAPAAFNGLKPTNLFQQDSLLYVSLGGFQGIPQNAGLAVVDVGDPANAFVVGQWESAAFPSGSAIVRVRNGLAYLGAMDHGLIVLDVVDPEAITFVSAYLPDPNWPGLVSYPPNARGMAFKGDTLLLAYDAGALRAIDVSDPSQPVEVGHYVNPQQPANTADAYNNVYVVGDRCYVTTDFCGFEVVDITDVAAMSQVAWVNPWNCNGLSWFGSDGHTNELITAAGDSLLFISGGNSEVLVYDITDPAMPRSVGGYIHPGDSTVAWGVDVRNDLVVLSCIDNSLVLFPPQPYYADRGGFQLFTWIADHTTDIRTGVDNQAPTVWPNPSNGLVRIRCSGPAQVTVWSVPGAACWRGTIAGPESTIDLSGLAPGTYSLHVVTSQWSGVSRLVLTP
jgi:hypothetical protein